MPESADVSAGDDILASQYNNLRKDVVDPNLGHKHTGAAGEGVALGSPLLPNHTDVLGGGGDGSLNLSILEEIDNAEIREYTALTVESGGELRPASGQHGLIVRCQGAITIESGGKIHADAFGGTGGSTGIAAQDGFVTFDDNLPDAESIKGIGGNINGRRSRMQIIAALNPYERFFVAYGAGGGGANVSPNGGDIWAGGGLAQANVSIADKADGGGFVILIADTIDLQSGGEITARGIIGGGTVSDPGGGGGGGLVLLIARTITIVGIFSAAGGAVLGAGAGVGADGVATKKILPA